MTYKFSLKSNQTLLTCDKRLQEICHEAIQVYDFSIICGYRNKEDQNEAFKGGKSNARWGMSKHNQNPSHAVDIVPYPVDWGDKERFAELAGVIKGIAFMKKIPIRWGGDFKSIKDMSHFEIVQVQLTKGSYNGI